MRRLRRTLAAIAASTLFALPAFAQDEPDEPAPTDAPIEETVEEAPPADGAPEAAVVDGDAPFPRISDDQETIYAVQRKAYLVDDRIELTLMGSASFTDRFVQSFGPAGAVTYHIAENFGLQFAGVYMFPNESGLTTEILEQNQLTPEVAKLTQMLWAAGLGAEWSPIYGKLEVFGASLGNFNFFVNVAAGVGQTRVECVRGLALDENTHGAGATCPRDPGVPDPLARVYEPTRLQFMTAVGGGVRFYFTNSLGLLVEVKDWIFPARVFRPGTNEPSQRFTDSIRNNVLVQVGISYLFGGEE